MLEIGNLSAGYGSFQALFDVSLSVKAGEAIAVIGPNGAGKTTLLRAISRLIDTSGGDLVMEGRRYNDIPAHDVVSLGIAQVPEGRRLFPRLTVEDNLMMGVFTPAARSEAIASRAEALSVSPKANRPRRLGTSPSSASHDTVRPSPCSASARPCNLPRSTPSSCM